MKLNLLKESINRFYESYFQNESSKWLWWYANQKNCSHSWLTERETFERDFSTALTSQFTQRLWKRNNHRPKELMELLVRTNPELAFLAFKDLFDEEGDLQMRLDRFIYYCDEILSQYRLDHKREIETNHHQDFRSISLYLSLQYPESYVYYRFDIFKELLFNLGSLKLPERDDPVRYFKLMRTVHKFLQDDERYDQLHNSRLVKQRDSLESMWLSLEFVEWITGIGAVD